MQNLITLGLVGLLSLTPALAKEKTSGKGALSLEEGKAAPATIPASAHFGDLVRVPYQSFKVYRMALFPGTPAVIELPQGESAQNIWYDKKWWMAESVPGSNRVLVRAIEADGIQGKKTLLHIEMAPSGLRLSFALEAVTDFDRQPAVFQVYMDAEDPEALARKQLEAKVAERLTPLRANLEAHAQAELENWKGQALAKVRTDYRVKGKVDVSRVVDDGTQTFIYSNAPELSALSFVNRDKKEEALNSQLQGGRYVVNRVLQMGERFVLTVGDKQTTVSLN